MAKTKAAAADQGRHDDQLADPVVTPGDMPKLLFVFNDDVHGFVEGEPIEPGKEYELDFAIATINAAEKKGHVTGTAE